MLVGLPVPWLDAGPRWGGHLYARVAAGAAPHARPCEPGGGNEREYYRRAGGFKLENTHSRVMSLALTHA